MNNLITYVMNGDDPEFTQPDGFDIMRHDTKLLGLFKRVCCSIININWNMQFVRCEFKHNPLKYWILKQVSKLFLDSIYDYIIYLYYGYEITYDPTLWPDLTSFYNWWLSAPSFQKIGPLLCCDTASTELLIHVIYDTNGNLSKDLFICTAVKSYSDNNIYKSAKHGNIILGVYVDPVEDIDTCTMVYGNVESPIDFSTTCELMTVDGITKFYPNPDKKIIDLYRDVTIPLPALKVVTRDDKPVDVYFIYSMIPSHFLSCSAKQINVSFEL